MTAIYIRPYLYDNHPVMHLSIPAFDRYWIADTAKYVGPGGSSEGDPDRYGKNCRELERALRGERTLFLPILYWSKYLAFIDGRHRYAAARDYGLTSIPVLLAGADFKPLQDLTPIQVFAAQDPDPRTASRA